LTLRDLLATGALYWTTIYPRARHELARWHRYAASIPDPILREHALKKLTDERLNPEAAALFAAIAPRRARPRLIVLVIAYQLLYDYLDAVNELPGSRGLANGLQLHLALVDALQPREPPRDPYLKNPQRADGAYAYTLSSTCAYVLATLPSHAPFSEILSCAAERCRQAQARNHAMADYGAGALRGWCQEQAVGHGLLWWETAAAGISCLGIYALLALAADPLSVVADAEGTDAAYFPGVCAISALLDSLADHYADHGTSNHSFTAHYGTETEAAERLTTITRDTARRLNGLPRERRHAFILDGIIAFYLSAPTLHPSFSKPVAKAVIQVSKPATRAMRTAMRVRRHIGQPNTRQPNNQRAE
jgi:tetraprenyl-beta-curcumene synthase